MPWDVEDIRNIVRRAGLIALAFSAGLWCVQAIESNYHPTAKPAPIYRTSADDRAAWLAAHTNPKSRQITAAPNLTPKPTPVPKLVPLSTVKLIGYPIRAIHSFEVHLYKKDGWFETQIPISAETQVTIWNPHDQYNTGWIKIMIGDEVFSRLPEPGLGHGLTIVAVFPYNDTTANKQIQYVGIPSGDVRTIKLKLFPDDAPDDMVWRVDVLENTQAGAHEGDTTKSIAREEAAMEVWERK